MGVKGEKEGQAATKKESHLGICGEKQGEGAGVAKNWAVLGQKDQVRGGIYK